jgi:hypothetical protein
VTFVNDDHVEEVGRKFLKETLSVLVGAPKGLVDAEVEVSVEVWWVPFNDAARFTCPRSKRGESVVSLIPKDQTVCEEQNSGWSFRVLSLEPTRFNEFPDDLESDEGFPRPSRHGEEDALLPPHDSKDNFTDSNLLKVKGTLPAKAFRTVRVEQRAL